MASFALTSCSIIIEVDFMCSEQNMKDYFYE